MQFKRLFKIELVFGSLMAAWLSTAPAALAQQQPRSATPPAIAGPTGLWIDHTGRGAVEITQCAEALCGRIVWLKEPNDKTGQPLRDVKNEDASRRVQTICGLQILGNLRLQSDGSWDKGWIYDPEQGERFDVELRLRTPELLQVKGYKGLKFLSETYQWKRATTPPGTLCAS
jgi:uncharacterized protein (DUF2147 family)